jgi:hypothetical protein
MTQITPKYKITAGPSKFDLAVALFHVPNTWEHQNTVQFSIEMATGEKRYAICVITGAHLKDGWRRDKWTLTGWLPEKGSDKHFSAEYETNSRTGYLDFEF